VHRLDPDNETYAAEIEREIFNEGLGHLDVPANGIRYFSNLNGKKEGGSHEGSCCEGQGSRLYGSLPEYIFSTLPGGGGVYVNVYAPASITADVGGGDATVNVTVETLFPYGAAVRVTVTPSAPAAFDVALRMPGWLSAPTLRITVDGGRTPALEGARGAYLHVSRQWPAAATTFDFSLDAALVPHAYTGVTAVPPFVRFAYTFGAVLLAVVGDGAWNATARVMVLRGADPLTPGVWAAPAHDGNALHWSVAGAPGVLLVPAWEVDSRTLFSAFPAFDAPPRLPGA